MRLSPTLALLQVSKALLCLVLLLCGTLAATASAAAASVEEEQAGVAHGLRHLLARYQCSKKVGYLWSGGKTINSKTWWPEEGHDAEYCCTACKNNRRCKQWHFYDDTSLGGAAVYCYLFDGSAKMVKFKRDYVYAVAGTVKK